MPSRDFQKARKVGLAQQQADILCRSKLRKEREICLVVHDPSDNTRALLQSGCVDFAISQDFYRQGYLPLNCLRELLHLGKEPERDQINTYISVIYSQNMD